MAVTKHDVLKKDVPLVFNRAEDKFVAKYVISVNSENEAVAGVNMMINGELLKDLFLNGVIVVDSTTQYVPVTLVAGASAGCKLVCIALGASDALSAKVVKSSDYADA